MKNILRTIRKTWALISPVRQRRLYLLVAMMTAAAGLEVVGIGSLLPLTAIMQRPELLQTNAWLASLSGALGNPSANFVFATLLFGLLCLFVLKNSFILFLSVYQFRFVGDMASLSTRLLSSYLYRPYTFHLQVNTAQLVRNITNEVHVYLYYALIPSIVLVSEILVITALFALIVLVDPVAATFSLMFGSAAVYLFLRSYKSDLSKIGADIQTAGWFMTQYAQEGLGGIKEIKVLSCESYFLGAFDKYVQVFGRGHQRSLVINALPKLVLETLFIVIIVGILLILSLQGRTQDALPLMAVYAACAFRLIPGLNRIMSAINALKLAAPSVTVISDDLAPALSAPRTKAGPEFEFRKELEIRDVSYSYPEAKAQALRKLSVCISHGEMVGFRGKSGSGKTTLIDIILGLLEPTEGQVLVDGRDIRTNIVDWQNSIGYIPQSIYLTDDTIRRNVALGVEEGHIDDVQVWSALEAAQLADFVRGLPGQLQSIVGERGVRLSGGQRQRIGIARAMYRNPSVLILDEATSALDNETEAEIVNTIRRLHGTKTILMIAHRLSTIEDCDRIFQLDQGRLVAIEPLSDARQALY